MVRTLQFSTIYIGMPKTTLGKTCQPLRNMLLFAHAFSIFLLFFFTINNEHIQKRFLKSLCLILLFHLLFREL